MSPIYLFLLLIISLLGIFLAGIFVFQLLKEDDIGENVVDALAGMPMIDIVKAIRQGAGTYLWLEGRALAITTVLLAFLLVFYFGWDTSLCFVIGAVSSSSIGFVGMSVGVRANSRVTWAARKGLANAFSVAFKAGNVSGLVLMGLHIITAVLVYYIFQDLKDLLALSAGASLSALFAQIGGGIYTKAADIGADLAGKVEKDLPEDDPRNAAVIADQVGDNVGDSKSRQQDDYDSGKASTVAAAVIAASLGMNVAYIVLPFMFFAVGLLASIASAFFVLRGQNNKNPERILNRGLLLACLVFFGLAFLAVQRIGVNSGVFWVVVVGMAEGVLISLTTDFFTSIRSRVIENLAQSALGGPAILIMVGLAYGFLSVVPSLFGICLVWTTISWLASYFGLVEIYVVAMSAVGLLAISGTVMANDAFGPIVDNAAGLATMAEGIDGKVLKITAQLDAAGNMSKAVTKGFTSIAAALTVSSLFISYAQAAELGAIDLSLLRLDVLSGMFLGVACQFTFFFLLLVILAKGAFVVLEEVRWQFKFLKSNPVQKRPDYNRCITICASYALKGLALPAVLACLVPPVVGVLLGTRVLAGFLAPQIFLGVPLALFMSNAGGAFDNAKKWIEKGNLGGKGSFAHLAAVVGDTVGDGLKDLLGPSGNTFITLIFLVAMLFVGGNL